MQRLTEKDDLGNWCLKGVRWEQLRTGQVITKEVSERLYGVLCKLMDYEDTGCSPNDVIRLDDFEQSNTSKLLKQLNAEEKKHRWIPVEERLPEDCVPVIVTWINENPQPYYEDIKDVPFTDTAVYCNEKWHWWSSTCIDYLKEYGKCDWELVNKDIDIVAWMPLPEPYRPDEEEKPVANIAWKGHYKDRFEKVE